MYVYCSIRELLSLKVDFRKCIAAGAAALTLSGGNLLPVNAANYGGFGSTYAEVVDPKDVQYSDSAGSEDVKSGLAALKTFKATIGAMKADLAKDTNIELTARVKKELPIGSVRNSLNKYNSAFSEDTQRGTDRLIRNLVQDLAELDRETLVKAGRPRSEAKVTAINKRLTAAEDALAGLEAFAPK